MNQTLLVKQYTKEELQEANEKEIWRYAGYFGDLAGVEDVLRENLTRVKSQLEDAFEYRVCFRSFPLEWADGMPRLPFPCKSKHLARALTGCTEIVIFAATIGLKIDRYIMKNQYSSVTNALLAQAYGAERIEALCDAFCNEIKIQAQQTSRVISPRYSPGYGDLPLEIQRNLFTLLDCSRQIGLTLNESLLMSPSKSVTAIFGIGPNKRVKPEPTCKCSECSKINCEFRER